MRCPDGHQHHLYSNVVVGQTICKYGKTTGYGCGEVE